MKANGKSGFSFFKKVIKNLLLTILVFVPLVSYLGTSLFIEARSPVDKDPYVHWSGLDPHTEVFVSWETSEKLDSVVEYGTTPDLEEKTSITQEHQMHRIKLSGLSPGKKYYYQASDSSGVYLSPVQYFFTAPLSNSGNAKSFNVTFISDTQQLFGTGHWNTIARSIVQFEDSAFLSIAGDVGQEEEDQDTWNFFWKHA